MFIDYKDAKGKRAAIALADVKQIKIDGLKLNIGTTYGPMSLNFATNEEAMEVYENIIGAEGIKAFFGQKPVLLKSKESTKYLTKEEKKALLTKKVTPVKTPTKVTCSK